mmetsp:Transcript_3011/g.8980  ORF Transcript_3011/g.8980 Transcript_3011/m.8980 type:complete len:242 (+) Transcript_3011:4171-4896(+)
MVPEGRRQLRPRGRVVVLRVVARRLEPLHVDHIQQVGVVKEARRPLAGRPAAAALDDDGRAGDARRVVRARLGGRAAHVGDLGPRPGGQLEHVNVCEEVARRAGAAIAAKDVYLALLGLALTLLALSGRLGWKADERGGVVRARVRRCARALLDHPLLLLNVEDMHVVEPLTLVVSSKDEHAAIVGKERGGVSPAGGRYVAHHVCVLPRHRFRRREKPGLIEDRWLTARVDATAAKEHSLC